MSQQKRQNKRKKRVTIVTWIGGGNFGTSLQSFALHKKLESLGYDVCIVIPFPQGHNKFKDLIIRLVKIIGIDTGKIKRLIIGDKRTNKQKKLDSFEKENYNIRKIYYPFQLTKLNRNTDVYVTGSDQIWNTAYQFNGFYFLDFANNVRRISYASSMGISDFPTEHKEKVKSLLSKFHKIGVREETAAKSISGLLNRADVRQVLDPTFLLTGAEWTELCKKTQIEILLPNKYIFCYFIGNNPWYKQQVECVKKKTGINQIIQISLDESDKVVLSDAFCYNDAGPLEFVRLIRDSTLVCTDSFHATAISINLGKDFVEFMRFRDTDSCSQNSRIYDLLSHYDLKCRIYSDTNTEWSDCIDYKRAHKKLQYDRKKSLCFLVESIEK